MFDSAHMCKYITGENVNLCTPNSVLMNGRTTVAASNMVGIRTGRGGVMGGYHSMDLWMFYSISIICMMVIYTGIRDSE